MKAPKSMKQAYSADIVISAFIAPVPPLGAK
jgi:hypothetical protein